mgnify:CR=1 FL=1
MVNQKKPQSLDQIRKKIDELDLLILKALSERVRYVLQAGEMKKKNNDASFYKPEREAQIIRNIVSKNHSAISKESLEIIYKEIISQHVLLKKKK